MSLTANWTFPTSIRFGAGRIAELPEACRASKIKRPILVTDTGLSTQSIVTKACTLLEDDGLSCETFSDIKSNPDDRNLAAGIAAFRKGRHDGVVAIGGGSSLGLGKLIAFMSGQMRPVWDFEDLEDRWTRADSTSIAPIVAIPTTAGTGSEVGRAAVITDSITRVKKIIFHPKMLPTAVISDPELTVGMPLRITAGTGMDALAHCLEAYCAPYYHPLATGVAVEGIRLVKENLPRVYRDNTDMQARSHMMTASVMGGVAFQKGLGAIHALSHPVGAMYDSHHGTTNAIVMPAVLRFNRPAIEQTINKLAAYLGIMGAFDGFIDFVLALRNEV